MLVPQMREGRACPVEPSGALAAESGWDMSLSSVIGCVFLLGCVSMMLWVVLELRRAQRRLRKTYKKVRLVDVLSYRADLFFSSDPMSKPIALLGLTMLLILVGGMMLYVCGPSDASLPAKLWQAWVFIADTAAHAEYGGTLERFVSFLLTICGMLVFGFLVGIVTDTIGERVEQLKKGKSRVLESNHTLILNWSDKVIPVIAEICLANESESGGTIVVLAERDKEDMEREIAEGVGKAGLRGSVVVVRSGSPVITSELRKVAATAARAIIVMSAENVGPDASDAMALRVTLSLMSLEKLDGHITVELSDIDNRHLVQLVGRNRVETIVSHDLIGRMMIQCARQPGLARVLDSLLGFDGHEFYFSEHKELVGHTFEEAVFCFPSAIVIGIKEKKSGAIHINPSGSTRIGRGDLLIVLAEDDDTYSVKIPAPQDLARWRRQCRAEFKKDSDDAAPEQVLFIGWRRDLDDMIVQLDEYVAKGSKLVLFSQLDVKSRENNMKARGFSPKSLKNLELIHAIGNSISRRHLHNLLSRRFDSVLILADEHLELDVTKMDSRSLTTLLLIRDIMSKQSRGETTSSKRTGHATSLRHCRRASQDVYVESKRHAASPPSHILKENTAQNKGVDAPEPTYPASPPGSPAHKRGVSRHDSGNHPAEWIRGVLKGETRSIEGDKSPRTSIISEILDSRTKQLVQSGSVSDFVASNELISKALAMVAERQEVARVLQELLSAVGCEVYLRSVSRFCKENEELSFYDLMARGRQKGEIIIGYQRAECDDVVALNPDDKGKTMTWSSKDLIITIAVD